MTVGERLRRELEVAFPSTELSRLSVVLNISHSALLNLLHDRTHLGYHTWTRLREHDITIPASYIASDEQRAKAVNELRIERERRQSAPCGIGMPWPKGTVCGHGHNCYRYNPNLLRKCLYRKITKNG